MLRLLKSSEFLTFCFWVGMFSIAALIYSLRQGIGNVWTTAVLVALALLGCLCGVIMKKRGWV